MTENQWRALAVIDDQEWEIFRASDPAKLGGREISAEANIKRAVACWNACAGIPTEQLEAGCVEKLAETTELLLKTAQHFERQASQGTGSRRGGPVWTKVRATLAPFQKENGQ